MQRLQTRPQFTAVSNQNCLSRRSHQHTTDVCMTMSYIVALRYTILRLLSPGFSCIGSPAKLMLFLLHVACMFISSPVLRHTIHILLARIFPLFCQSSSPSSLASLILSCIGSNFSNLPPLVLWSLFPYLIARWLMGGLDGMRASEWKCVALYQFGAWSYGMHCQ